MCTVFQSSALQLGSTPLHHDALENLVQTAILGLISIHVVEEKGFDPKKVLTNLLQYAILGDPIMVGYEQYRGLFQPFGI